MTDTEILDLLLQQQEIGLIHLRTRYESYCMAIASRILPCKEDAEEVVSDTWLRLWARLPEEVPANLPAYLAKITRNLAMDRYRENHSGRRGGGEVAIALEELGDVIAGQDQASANLLAKELSDAIRRFLAGLSQRDRSIFLRRYFYMESDFEIAARYGLMQGSIRAILSRIRKKLKTYLKKEGYL